ncbi:ribonuclease HII [Allomuricauda sp. SCSIO 65647]|uniref:ribonuclease HII n=1 Tax=Allomuricauda sp. SCSIO 65647 TaxID=2908843 RepID=UPI001F454A2B|nr:ribonuclease HII [Muricauda sp. SCSIO 65647]UJH66476.1 ribonuclease HII [Muricauda sp. SCSIO 65647]
MRLRTLLITTLLVLASCTPEKKVLDPLLGHLPPNAALIIRINDFTGFKSELKNQSFLSGLASTSLYGAIHKTISGLDNLTLDSESLLAFYEVGKERFEFILATKENSIDFVLDDIDGKTIETLSYEGTTIKHYQTDEDNFYQILQDGKIMISSSQLLAENLVRTKGPHQLPKTLERLYKSADEQKSANLFFDFDSGADLIASQLVDKDAKSVRNFADWMYLDFQSNQDFLGFRGVTLATDSTNNRVKLFENTTPLTNRTAALAPLNASAILSYTFNDYGQFAQNQNDYLEKVQSLDTLFNAVEEVGLIFTTSKKAIVLNTFGTENLSTFVESKKIGTTNYQGKEILRLSDSKWLSEAFAPLVRNIEVNFCTVIENAFVFSEAQETLQTIISNYVSGATFDKSTAYKTAIASLANESSILFVSTTNGIEYFLDEFFESSIGKDFENAKMDDNSFAAQIVADNGFYHTNIFVSAIEKTKAAKSVSPLFTLQLDTDLATDPQFVKNHRTNKQEIVVQDQDNHLYLISTDGKVLWKKQLDGKIQGKIHQVDIYKNGKLQLAFTTNDQFLIVDRNGEIVEPFDKTYEGGNLNGLSVFDYDGRKDYRFVVTQGSKVFMYNRKGNIVDGFKYTETESPVITSPKHFRIDKKDYLIFQLQNGELKIRHRAGQERIKVPQKIDFSNNEVFFYKNKFSITDKKGVLHQINTRGKLTTTNFNLNNDHGMYATSKTLALMNDNVLSIKGRKIELDLGVYTAPKIFYIYDKIYVAVTDIQSQKVYLFDSQAKSIANFPVFGSSTIDMADIDSDRKLELVAKDQDNSIIVYKMN